MAATEKTHDAYLDRKDRYRFLLEHFGADIRGAASVLDVGCDDNHLKATLGERVFGIDIAGTPDRKVDLEKEGLSMFSDGQFEISICTEVLEHIDNLHAVFDDLARVSSKAALISLPNCTSWGRMSRLLRTGSTGKFYGIPVEKPLDRHKWFFSWREALSFFEGRSPRAGFKVERVLLHANLVWASETNPARRLFQRLKAFAFRRLGLSCLAQNIFVLLRRV